MSADLPSARRDAETRNPPICPKLKRQLSEKQSAKLRRIFDTHDAGSKGYLSFAEFRRLLQSLGKEVMLQLAKEMVLDDEAASRDALWGRRFRGGGC